MVGIHQRRRRCGGSPIEAARQLSACGPDCGFHTPRSFHREQGLLLLARWRQARAASEPAGPRPRKRRRVSHARAGHFRRARAWLILNTPALAHTGRSGERPHEHAGIGDETNDERGSQQNPVLQRLTGSHLLRCEARETLEFHALGSTVEVNGRGANFDAVRAPRSVGKRGAISCRCIECVSFAPSSPTRYSGRYANLLPLRTTH